MTKLTIEESNLMLSMLNAQSVSPLNKNAVALCQMAQSIAEKLIDLTEKPEATEGEGITDGE
jgi:hypothetical protein